MLTILNLLIHKFGIFPIIHNFSNILLNCFIFVKCNTNIFIIFDVIINVLFFLISFLYFHHWCIDIQLILYSSIFVHCNFVNLLNQFQQFLLHPEGFSLYKIIPSANINGFILISIIHNFCFISLPNCPGLYLQHEAEQKLQELTSFICS